MHDNDDDNNNDFENTDEIIEERINSDEFTIINEEPESSLYDRQITPEEGSEIIEDDILNEKQQFKINEIVEVYNSDKKDWFKGIITKFKDGTYDIKYDTHEEEFIEQQFIRKFKEDSQEKLDVKHYCKSVLY